MAKKKRKQLKIILLVLFIVAVAGAAAYFIYQRINKPRFVRYPAFGISIPVNYTIHGIDVSRYQNNVDWTDVKAMQVKEIKMGFGFIKATEGLGRVDEQFRRNWAKAKEAGMPRGAYHFFVASKSGKAQAENFIETVKLEKGDLPPVLDIESTNGVNPAELQQRARDFLQVLEAHYKVKPIIYTYVDFYKIFLGEGFDAYPLWIAHYEVPERPRIDRKWTFWQHNSQGHVNGIRTFVDFNVFNGDSTAFKKLLLK